MSRNLNEPITRTQREYFNASYFNKSGSNQLANYATTLAKPFFHNPQEWQLAINRMRIPLSGIPLSRNNLPFQEWQVALQYQTQYDDPSSKIIINYVKQYNEVTRGHYLSYIVNQDLSIEVYDFQNNYNLLYTVDTNDGAILNSVGDQVIPSIDKLVSFLFMLSASIPNTINVYDVRTGVLVYQIACPFTPTAITSDDNHNVFIAMNDASNLIKVYSYNHSLSGVTDIWTLDTIYTWSSAFVGVKCTALTWCNTYFLGSTIYLDSIDPNIRRLNIIKGIIGTPALVNINLGVPENYLNYNPIIISNQTNNFVYVNNKILVYDLALTTVLVNYTPLTTTSNLNTLYGFDYLNNLLVSCAYSGEDGILALSPDSASIPYIFNPLSGCYTLTTSMYITQEQISGGAYDIFSYQEYLNKINEALVLSFTQIKIAVGAAYIPTEAPFMVYNSTNKMFNIVCEGAYTITNSDGSPTFQIIFNQNLWNKFYFPSNDYLNINETFQAIIIKNYGINAIAGVSNVGTGASTLPQFIYVQQEQSTIYQFYDLTRIIVTTSRIPVSGDGEGITFSNSSYTSNNTLNMITDIIPDTSTLNPSSVIIYIPAGILRWYNLYAQQPFTNIDLSLFYETKDGNIYPIIINNGEFFSVKLEFKKGDGDF